MNTRPRKPTLEDLEKLEGTFIETHDATNISTDEVIVGKLVSSGAKVVCYTINIINFVCIPFFLQNFASIVL